MGTVRYFSGSRDGRARSKASELMRIELMKKGKLSVGDRYKRILKMRFEESKLKAFGDQGKPGKSKMPTSLKQARQMSKRAEHALKQIAARKAAKEAKALRKMVLVTPRTYPTGSLTKKGKIYDVAGNMVAEVNTKNGKISTTMGWSLGKYKPKSYFTDMLIQDSIHKYSPYFINLRKMQAMQQGQGGVWADPGHGSINLYGSGGGFGGGGGHGDSGLQQYYGAAAEGPRQNVGVTAWGAMSDNAWGTFSDNVWGGSLDNAWGGNSSDVWGGIGVGGMWGVKGQHVWGTGNGTNYLKGLTSRVAAFFGLNLKTKSRGGDAHEHANAGRGFSATRSAGGAHEHAAVTRAPTTTRSAPSTRH